MFKYTVLTPAECNVEELKAFKEVVVAGNSVPAEGLLGRIRNAVKLVFVRDATSNKLVGVGAIKTPKDSYVERVFNSASCEMKDPADYTRELGWLAVTADAANQGIVKQIIGWLLSGFEGKLFSTTYAESEVAKALSDAGFVRTGVPFASSRDDRTLTLFTK